MSRSVYELEQELEAAKARFRATRRKAESSSEARAARKLHPGNPLMQRKAAERIGSRDRDFKDAVNGLSRVKRALARAVGMG